MLGMIIGSIAGAHSILSVLGMIIGSIAGAHSILSAVIE